MKRLLYWIVLLIFVVFSLEAMAWAGLLVLKKLDGITFHPVRLSLSDAHREMLQREIDGKTEYYGIHPVLGWTQKPGGHWRLKGASYQANLQGIRANREFTTTPAKDIIRIAAFGDSYTHGDDVDNGFMWTEQMMAMNAKLEVLNFGVGGYGLDQAYLRYLQEGIQCRPHIVILGYMSADIERHIGVFKPFRKFDGSPRVKPRFKIRDGQLQLIPNPLPSIVDYENLLQNESEGLKRLGRNDYYFQHGYFAGPSDFLASFRLVKLLVWNIKNYFDPAKIQKAGFDNVESEAYQITEAIFDLFYETALKNGSQSVIIIFPNRLDLKIYFRKGIKRVDPLLAHFKVKGYRVIDFFEEFASAAGYPRSGKVPGSVQQTNSRDFFSNYGHYNSETNRLVAETIVKRLREFGLI